MVRGAIDRRGGERYFERAILHADHATATRTRRNPHLENDRAILFLNA